MILVGEEQLKQFVELLESPADGSALLEAFWIRHRRHRRRLDESTPKVGLDR